MGNYEDKLLDAIETIVDDKIKNAGYDRTISAKIVACVDPTIGKYRVRYQDSSFFAYAITTDVEYMPGSEVYILIASNDSSKDKTILGTIDKLGSNYTATPDEEEHYEVVGNNCIESKDAFEMCSYGGNQVKVVYDRDNADNTLINLNTLSVETYIRESGSIVCGGVFRTALPIEQQFRGNYGIIFELAFLDNASNDLILRSYYVDVNQMLGNPYKLTKATRQICIFDIDAVNFQYVNKISLFVKDFPNTREGEPADIFISDLELLGTIPLDQTEVESCALVITTPQGTYFNVGDLDDAALTLQAQVRVKGKNIDNDSQYLEYYWFVENCLIDSSSDKYNSYGGAGWACLNDYNIISGDITAWVPGSWEYVISKAMCPAKETRFKCVAVLNDLVLEKEIKIINYASLFDISVVSDSGTQFYYDIGNPNLTCLINNQERDEEGFVYAWAEADFSGNFLMLPETTEANQEYNDAVAGYASLKASIEAETAMAAASQEQLDAYLTTIKKYDKIIRVERNKIFSLNVNRITNFATYKCSVFKDGLFIGTGSIVLINSLENADYYNLVINNGTQVYKYDEAGVSPVSQALLEETQMTIPTLSFSIFDTLGMLLDDEVLRHCAIEWWVPSEDTMLIAPDGFDEEVDGYKIYKDRLTLDYEIAKKYNINSENNDIQLRINYKGISLVAKTNLTFTKEGEPGTNGTQFVAQIVPNAPASFTGYPMILNDTLNYPTYGDIDGQQWFRLQLWHNGDRIYNAPESGGMSTENKPVKLKWEVLKNKYNTRVSDNTDIQVLDAETGRFSYTGYEDDSHPANIVKCTVTYDGMTYYATLPMITAHTLSDYAVALVEDSGFRFVTYSPDGRRPLYNNSIPFELKVTRVINGVVEDVSNLTQEQKITFDWQPRGKVYEYNSSLQDFAFIARDYLIDRETEGLKNNQRNFKPNDDFNGECKSVGLECILSNNEGNEVGRIHIPVHFMLNRYGQAALNDWDGNSITIDEDGGVILAPQMGAGQKESDNSFTGVLMGKVKEANKTNTETGLFGYNHGVRTLFLDSETGAGIFGKGGPTGNGQIIIDPSNDKALLYSANFWKNYDQHGLPTSYSYSMTSTTSGNQAGAGLLIDLTTPSIKFGNGNFYVTSSGYIHAGGGGDIAGWNVTNSRLYTTSGGGTLSMWSNGSIEGSNGSDSWYIHSDGTASFNAGYIGGWNINHGSISGGNVTLSSNGDIDCSAYPGWHIHSDGTASFGNYFSIDSSGNTRIGANFMVGSDGITHIGGWVIGETDLHSADNQVYLRSGSGSTLRNIEVAGGVFYVQHNGFVHAQTGNIGGWTIDGNSIRKGSTVLSSSSTNGRFETSGWIITEDYIKNKGEGGDGGRVSLFADGTFGLYSDARWAAASNGVMYINSQQGKSLIIGDGFVDPHRDQTIEIYASSSNRIWLNSPTNGIQINGLISVAEGSGNRTNAETDEPYYTYDPGITGFEKATYKMKFINGIFCGTEKVS